MNQIKGKSKSYPSRLRGRGVEVSKTLIYFRGQCSCEIKNAPRGSHSGKEEEAACAARRRRKASQAKLFVIHRIEFSMPRFLRRKAKKIAKTIGGSYIG